MRLLLFFLSLTLVFRAAAQPENGYYEEKHPGGQKAASGKYKNGKKEGPWDCWSANGVLIRRENYHKGELHGRQTDCYGEKYITKISCYTNGLRDSTWLRYDEKGRLIAESNYRNDLPSGEWNFYDWTAGQQIRIRREFYREGLRDGCFIEWTNNGIRKKESCFSKDLRDSTWHEYDAVGRMTTESRYKNDLPEGDWSVYAWDGTESRIIRNEQYHLGKRNGAYEEWDAAGNRKVKALFKDDVMRAAPEAWSTSGAKLTSDKFDYCTVVLSSGLLSYYQKDTLAANAHMPGCKGFDPSEPIYSYVEQPPSFPGGPDSLKAFMNRNLRYPDLCKEQNIQGTVYVRMVIEKNGFVSQPTILRSVRGCAALDKEALRLVGLFPHFVPGKNQEKNVRCYFTLPVRFNLK